MNACPSRARLVAALLLTFAAHTTVRAREPAAESPPRMEVCFVLDTTGSMSGLIEGAKQKIWSIVNEFREGEPKPQLKLGLIGYRDRGDAYVTDVTDLTDDLDAVYAKLRKFAADGGGDTPESVNQALHEAVTRLHWSTDEQTLRIIFLVGDAPPHMDYPQDVKYPDTCRLALERRIKINTVQCGALSGTADIWQAIARKSEGAYVAIAQDGGMRVVATPYDEKIGELNAAMAETAIVYGDERQQAAMNDKLEAARESDGEQAAERNAALASMKAAPADADLVVTGRGDLVADVLNGDVTLREVDRGQLPEAYRAMSDESLREAIAANAARRAALQEQLNRLNHKRDEHLRRAREASAPEVDDGFDARIKAIVAEQAGRPGRPDGEDAAPEEPAPPRP